jgi:hypothetical protein
MTPEELGLLAKNLSSAQWVQNEPEGRLFVYAAAAVITVLAAAAFARITVKRKKDR